MSVQETPVPVEELARLSGCTVAEIENYVALGLLGTDALVPADVTAIRLIEALGSAGLSEDVLAGAVGEGRFSFGFARDLMAYPATMTGRSYGEILAEMELDPDFARAAFIAAGLPAIRLDRNAREDDLALLRLVRDAERSGVSRRALLRVLRVFGHGLRRIAEAERDLFRAEVEQPMEAANVPLGMQLQEAARRRGGLQAIGMEATQILLHRILEELVFDNIAVRIESALQEPGAAPAEHPEAVGFADLSGYTSFVREFGDREGAEKAAQFEEIAQQALDGTPGRIVKLLGDGLLIRFRKPEAAPAALAAIIDRAGAAGLPPIHVGLAAGPIISRDGDIYGTTVNRAARLAGQAGPGTILADTEMHRICGGLEDGWQPVELAPLKGLDDRRAFLWRRGH